MLVARRIPVDASLLDQWHLFDDELEAVEAELHRMQIGSVVGDASG